MNNLLAEQIIQDMNNLLAESYWRNRKAVEEIGKPLKKIFSDFLEIRKPLNHRRKPKLWVRKIWGLILTQNFWPHARMDLPDWFFSFSTAHNFSFSNEVTITSTFDTITAHKFLRGHLVSSCHLFTLQELLANTARKYQYPTSCYASFSIHLKFC